jgi:hypothetical protein
VVVQASLLHLVKQRLYFQGPKAKTLKGVFFVCLSLYSEYDGKATVVVTAVTTTTYL